MAHTKIRLFVFLLLSITEAAYAASGYEDAIVLTYEKQPKEQFQTNTKSQCAFVIKDIADERQNKQTLGTNFQRSLDAKGIDAWLGDVKSDLIVPMLPTSSEGARIITVQPALMKLYSYAQSLNIHGIIAIKVDYLVDGKVIDTRHYRGYKSKANWNNGIGEFLTAVNLSAGDVFPKLVNDLPSVCDKLSQATQ